MKRKSTEAFHNRQKTSRQKTGQNVFAAALWLLVLLPLILCIILFVRMGNLEKELREVKEMNAAVAEPGSFETRLKEMALAAETEDGKTLKEEKKNENEEEEKESNSKQTSQVSNNTSGKEPIDDGKKHVYLTFDDGPSDHTEDILELLEKNGMTATFFCIGKTDEYSKEMYQRIIDGGHTLAMHSYSHDYPTLYASLSSFKEDFHKIQDYFEEVTGVKPMYYRFPGGSSNTVSKVSMKKCIKFLAKEGVNYYDWNALNGDAEGKTYSVEEMLKRTISGVKLYDSPVVLMHDTNAKQRTLEMLPKLIKKLKKMDAVVEGIDENTPLVQHIKVSSVVTE